MSLAATITKRGRTISSTLKPVGERETIPALLRRNAERFPGQVVYSERRAETFQGVGWREFLCRVVSFGRLLHAHGIGKGDRVAVLSRNRGEMLITELTVMSIGAIHVPIFAGYSAEQSRQLIEQAGASAIVLSDRAQLEKVGLPARARLIVSFEAIEREAIEELLAGFEGTLLSFAEALEQRAVGSEDDPAVDRFFRDAARIAPTDPCLMMYTSGTAGEQKGVVLSHDNILSQQRALRAIWNLTPRDRFLSYLPWHHSFGGIFEKYNALYNAAPLALDGSHGKDFPLLLANWKEVQPTVYFSVPAVYQQLVHHVQTHPEDESRIFHDGLKFVFTAAAPLPANISAYFAAKGIPVVEGWGLTETSPCCTVTDLGEPRTIPGMVGYPIPDVKVRLAEDGEILIRGPNVMLGYHENPQATREALPGDGWFRTGDLGEFAGKGLKLVARKDRVFKLLNGERVVPTPLENRLAGMCKYIRHVVVAGSGRRSLCALIFPDFPLIEQEFRGDREAADRAVKASLREVIEELNETHPVRYERIGAFAIVGRTLSVENGALTPSMKVRVSRVLGDCEEYVEAIYEPSGDCDCLFLRRVLRVEPDPRPCYRGRERTLDRCHECGLVVLPEVEELRENRSDSRRKAGSWGRGKRNG